MQNAMYTALFGALSNEHRMDNIANNLANVNTTGYKRDVLSFKDTFQRLASDQVYEPVSNIRQDRMFPEPQHFSKTREGIASLDVVQGAIKATGGQFDTAISGDGFFKIQTQLGQFYTRNGRFKLTNEGLMVNEEGYPVVSEGGGITIPPGTDRVTISEDGRVFAGEDLVGTITMVGLEDPGMLEKLGRNMYRPRNGAELVEIPTESTIAQGFLEASNVDPVYEMVNMIEAQRQFEAYAKVMQTSQQIDSEASTKVGRGR